MSHKLPDLSFAYDALEPYIDARTMEIHHQKHHGTYVSKLNAALESDAGLQNKPLEELIKELNSLPESIRGAVRNNGGGHYNHAIFWQIMAPGKGGNPVGQIGQQIDNTFGSFEQFKDQFKTAAVNRFGSGWAWLVLDPQKQLRIMSTANQDNPVTDGYQALMGIDVWEHAYYLKYQNRRPDYIDNWWNVVNWEKVNQRYLELAE